MEVNITTFLGLCHLLSIHYIETGGRPGPIIDGEVAPRCFASNLFNWSRTDIYLYIFNMRLSYIQSILLCRAFHFTIRCHLIRCRLARHRGLDRPQVVWPAWDDAAQIEEAYQETNTDPWTRRRAVVVVQHATSSVIGPETHRVLAVGPQGHLGANKKARARRVANPKVVASRRTWFHQNPPFQPR